MYFGLDIATIHNLLKTADSAALIVRIEVFLYPPVASMKAVFVSYRTGNYNSYCGTVKRWSTIDSIDTAGSIRKGSLEHHSNAQGTLYFVFSSNISLHSLLLCFIHRDRQKDRQIDTETKGQTYRQRQTQTDTDRQT